MTWMPSLKTGTLIGVGESAAHIAAQIATAEADRRASMADEPPVVASIA
jgi:hypothetical protein